MYTLEMRYYSTGFKVPLNLKHYDLKPCQVET